MICVERGDLMLEPGGTYIDGVVTRAPQVETLTVDPKDELIAALMAKLGL